MTSPTPPLPPSTQSTPPMPPTPAAQPPKESVYRLRGTSLWYNQYGDLVPGIMLRQYTWSQVPLATILFAYNAIQGGMRWAHDPHRNTWDFSYPVPAGPSRDPARWVFEEAEVDEDFVSAVPCARDPSIQRSIQAYEGLTKGEVFKKFWEERYDYNKYRQEGDVPIQEGGKGIAASGSVGKA